LHIAPSGRQNRRLRLRAGLLAPVTKLISRGEPYDYEADDPLLAEFPGAQLVVRVRAERIFPNCPRYVHQMQLLDYSVYAPRAAHEPPEPDWKRMEVFRDALPRRKGRR